MNNKTKKHQPAPRKHVWETRAGWSLSSAIFVAILAAQTIGLASTIPPDETISTHAATSVFVSALVLTALIMVFFGRWLLQMPDEHTPAKNEHAAPAHLDTLTGLLNRTRFIEKLEYSIRTFLDHGHGRLAVIAFDIDGFREINDSLGHEAGDALIATVSKRIARALPPGATLSRSSGDEFAAVVHLGPGQPDSAAIVERVFAAMLEPVRIGTDTLQVRISIGVAHCPEDGQDARQAMKSADIALSRAKEDGAGTVRYYSQDLDQAIRDRFQMLRDLRTALDKGQLRLYYQPQVDLKTGALVGAEALLRWWLPDNSEAGGKYISPADFVPLAEEAGLISSLGEFALRSACTMNKKLQDAGLPPIRVAVNISGAQFHDTDLVALVERVLEESGLEPHWLELEVTESAFMEDIMKTVDTLNRLHDLGVELAVDDFGTGYSSLSYLRQFPLDRLKIDQSFTRNTLTSRDDQVIVRTIISLGHNLGMKVLAEGVETDAHVIFLKHEGCDEAQGYLYAKPLPENEFVTFVTNHAEKKS